MNFPYQIFELDTTLLTDSLMVSLMKQIFIYDLNEKHFEVYLTVCFHQESLSEIASLCIVCPVCHACVSCKFLHSVAISLVEAI